MIIIPAVDIFNGKVVRLIHGNPENCIVYHSDPFKVIKLWEKEGAEYLHIVDLNAALRMGNNLRLIEKILKNSSVSIEIGGGIDSIEKASRLCDLGASRIVVGTVVILNIDFLKKLREKIGSDRIVVALDYRNGKVAIEGWKKFTEFDIASFSHKIDDFKISAILLTAIAHDGKLVGPDIKTIKKVKAIVKTPIIASGGISSIEDIKKLMGIKVYGAIIGRALYEGKINLKEAIKTVKEESLCLQKE
ncbi:MAG: 1-(5-phosphoribosyl)-5-[(5-phosphoribosylamino)methylideneamino]imidazole-4-carboxamide isomerase [Candidatus Bathyarchaeia archaeon]